MKRVVGALAAFAIAASVASMTAGAAIAEPKAEHVVGDQCIGADIGRRDVAPNGQGSSVTATTTGSRMSARPQMIPGSPPRT